MYLDRYNRSTNKKVVNQKFNRWRHHWSWWSFFSLYCVKLLQLQTTITFLFLDRFGQSIYQNHGIWQYFSGKKWFVIISPIGHELWRHWWRRCSRSLPMVMTSLRWYPKNVKIFFLKNSQKIIWQICVICQNRSNNKKVKTVLILSYNVNQWRNKWRHLTGLPIFAGHLFIFLKCVTY